MRPRSIVLYERVFLAMMVAGIVAAVVGWDRQLAALERQPGVAAMATGVLAFTLAVSTLVYVLLWYFIARRASVVAKWIYVVLVVLSAGNLLREMLANGMRTDIVAAMNVIGLVLMLTSAALLFRRDAREWLGRDDGAAVAPE